MALDTNPSSSTSRVEWLPEAEVTTERLRQILIGAYCEAEHDKENLYVSHGIDFPTWIKIDTDRQLVHFFTHVAFVDEDVGQQVECANQLNADLLAVQFAAKDGHLWGCFWLPLQGEFNVAQFFTMLRRFSSAFLHGTRHPGARELFTEQILATKH